MLVPSSVRPDVSRLVALFSLGLVAACMVNETGLGRGPDGGAPAGKAGHGGLAGTFGTGVAGTGMATGAAGSEGAAGTGLAGVGGEAGATGVAGTGAAGTAGTGVAGTTGAAGAAGTGVAGTTGAAGTGAAGSTGAAGTGAAGQGGCGICRPCFRCVAGACVPEPNATWTVSCLSATIAPLKPSGAVWDSTSNSPPGTWPDAFCQLELEDGRSRETVMVTDSLTPTWNASVTPTTGMPLMARTLMSEQTQWRISVLDRDASDEDPVCTTLPLPTAADLEKGTLTLSNVTSCTKLTLGFTCLGPLATPVGPP